MNTLKGDCSRLQYGFMAMAVDDEESHIDNAYEIQKERKKLDLQQFNFMCFVDGYPINVDKIREVFMIHWERFYYRKDPIETVKLNININMKMEVRNGSED